MEYIPDLYNLETIEQLRAIADPLRLRILDALSQRALTATMLGEVLGLPANKTHYHVRELEKAGLVRLAETREKGGILEKYYRAVAKNISVPGTLLHTLPPDEGIAVANDYLQMFSRDFMRAFARALRSEEWGEKRITLSGTSLWLTDDEYQGVMGKVYELLEPYRQPRGVEGEREHVLALFAYDARLARDEDPAGEKAPPAARTPRKSSTMVAGAVYFTRRDLEAVVARGETLDLNVAGLVAFAGDIPADLAERAVAGFRHRGVLKASPDVRAVLHRKGGEKRGTE